jgi:hypothetical protein
MIITNSGNSLGPYVRVSGDVSESLVFEGRLTVHKVKNGYVIRHTSDDNKLPETYIAETPSDVNQRISAIVAAYKLDRP